MATTWDELKAMAVVARSHTRTEQLRARAMSSPTQCGTKATYTSEHQATTAATTIARGNGDRRMAIYKCHLCHLYHLTAKDRTT